MEDEVRTEKEGIEENSPLLGPITDRSASTKAPDVEIHLYKQGKGPIAVFRSELGGWEQDQLEVREILDRFGLKSLYAFIPDSGRGVSIRFHPRNGRSVFPYKAGSVIHIDGEPQDPMIKPVTKVFVGASIIVGLMAVLSTANPKWLHKFSALRGKRIPPWMITLGVIVFVRLRKRTLNFVARRG